MSELMREITAEAKRFLDEDRTHIYRELSRTAIVNSGGFDTEIHQSKSINDEEMQTVRTSGVSSLVTPEWFHDVRWLQELDDDNLHSWHNLRLDAIYPPDFLTEKPSNGSYVSRDDELHWQDQYGSISGFGSREKISLYLPQFVAPGERTVTTFRYPDDPTALDQYNARFRQYLEDLDNANPTVGYYRGWERSFSDENEKAPRTLGGLSLAGFGVYEVLHEGSSPAEDREDMTRIRLHFEGTRKLLNKMQKKYVGREIIITKDGAVTTPYWDGEDDKEQASEKLLARTLELVRGVAQE